MKNKSGRTIWFRRYFGAGLYPSTIEGLALFVLVVGVVIGLGMGSDWLLQADPLLALAGFILLPVIVVGFLIFAYRHSGPPE